MAEPVSIMAGVGSLILSCGQIAMAINTFVTNMKSMDETLAGFSDEVDSLGRVLFSIKALSDAVGRPTGLTGHEGELWTNMAYSINDCGGTLIKVQQILTKINTQPNARFNIPRKFAKLTFNKDEITQHRASLMQYKSTLSLSLQAISLANDAQQRQNTEIMMPALDDLTQEIRKLAIRVNAAPHKAETDRMGNCLRSAATIVSTASTIIIADDRQTVVGSEFDGVFKPRQNEAMDRWLRSNTVREPGRRAVHQGYDSEDEVSFDVVDAMIAKSRDSFPINPAMAERSARRAIEQMPAEPHTASVATAEKYFHAASLLADALEVQQKWEDCEVVLSELQFRQESLHERIHPGDRLGSPSALETQQKAATIALKRQDIDKAELLARKTLRSRTKLLGKDHPQRIETLTLLVDICRAKGENEEADVLLSLLPNQTPSTDTGSVVPQARISRKPVRASTSPSTPLTQSPALINPNGNIDIKKSLGLQMLEEIEHTLRSGNTAAAWQGLRPALAKMIGNWSFDRWDDLERSVLDSPSRSLRDLQGFTVLHFAARMSLPILTRDLIDLGVNLEAEDTDGSTALMVAVSFNHIDVCKVLVEKGAKPNTHNNQRTTPLHLAKDPVLMELLISHGAEIDAQDNENKTALHLAAENGNLTQTKLLLERNASVEVRNIYGHTPLSLAVVNSLMPITRLLIDWKADVNYAWGDQLLTPLHFATERGQVQLVKMLIDAKADINARDARQQTPLYTAVEKNQPVIVRLLLVAGADVNAVEIAQNTPLHCATRHGYLAIGQLLISHGADINVSNETMVSPLYITVENKNIAFARYLLENKADVNQTEQSLWTPLHKATADGHEALTKLLLDHSANIEARTFDLCTPLYHAACASSTKVASELLDAKAKVDIPQQNGWSPFSKASRDGKVDLMAILQSAGANIHHKNENMEEPIYLASSLPSPEAMQYLLDNGADIHARQKDGWTPLHYCACNGHVNAVRLLLKYKADTRLRVNSGESAMGLAAQRGRLEVIKVLLEAGASLDEEDKTWNPLLCAARNGEADVTSYLISKGAFINARNPHYANPLYCSVLCKNLQVFNMIAEAGGNIEMKNDYGFSPLLLATNLGALDIMKRCLGLGARVDAQESRGYTALHFTADGWQGVEGEEAEAARLLMKFGCRPTWKTIEGKTAIDLAREKGKANLVNILEGRM